MQNGCTKTGGSIYFQCRKEAALYNDKLNSREGASELLNVSEQTLRNYELGTTKVIPAEVLVDMAEIYNAPQILNHYCANDCPIGCRREMATEVKPLEHTTIGLLNLLEADKLGGYMKKLTGIAIDGKINDWEKDTMNEVVGYLNSVRVLVEELTLFYMKDKGKEAHT